MRHVYCIWCGDKIPAERRTKTYCSTAHKLRWLRKKAKFQRQTAPSLRRA